MKDNNPINSFKNPAFGGIFYLKKYGFILMLLIFSISVKSQAIIKVEESKKNFGTVQKGEVVHLEYKLTNEGSVPVIITNYFVECSCTSVDFDSKPIIPGASTIIKVKFDTKTVYERQDRIVIINSNNKKGDVKLRFKGFVKKH